MVTSVTIAFVTALALWTSSEYELSGDQDMIDDDFTLAIRTLCASNKDEKELDKELMTAFATLLAWRNVNGIKCNRMVNLRPSAVGCACDLPDVTISVSDALLFYVRASKQTLNSSLAVALLSEIAASTGDWTKVDAVMKMLLPSAVITDLLALSRSEQSQVERTLLALLSLVDHDIKVQSALYDCRFQMDNALRISVAQSNPGMILLLLKLARFLHRDAITDLKVGLVQVQNLGNMSSADFDYQTTYAAFFPVENDIVDAAPHLKWLECSQLAQNLING
jgi:hypothetical protein